MDTTVLPRKLIVTVDDSVNISSLTKAIKMLRGVTSIKTANTKKSRLYDPETGEYLNDKTMKVIEDASKGKDIAFSGSFDEFKEWAEAL